MATSSENLMLDTILSLRSDLETLLKKDNSLGKEWGERVEKRKKLFLEQRERNLEPVHQPEKKGLLSVFLSREQAKSVSVQKKTWQDPLFQDEVFRDLERAFIYIVRDANPKSTRINDLYYGFMKLLESDLSREQAAQRLRERVSESCFDTLSDDQLPAVLDILQDWSVDSKKEFALACENIAKKYLFLFMEVGRELEDEPEVTRSFKAFMKKFTESSNLKRTLRQGYSGEFGRDYNSDLSYHDLKSLIHNVDKKASKQDLPECESKSDVIAKRRKELDELVGLDSAKQIFEEYIATVLALQIQKNQYGLEAAASIPHVILTGNPGTCKTTLGRIASDLLWAYDVLPERKFTRVTRSDLVRRYIGATEHHVKNLLSSMIGGVIFVDEAHNLFAAEDDDRDFAHQVVGEINDFLEEHKNECVMILAGYRRGVEQLLTMDSGLASRFPVWVHIDDYSEKELSQIFNLKAQDYGIKLQSPELIKDITAFLKNKKESLEGQCMKEQFANGREVRNLAENFRTAISLRLYKAGKVPSQQDIAQGKSYPTLEEMQTVTTEDVQSVLLRERRRVSIESKNKIGFGVS
jgi:stage V sporulation protein K